MKRFLILAALLLGCSEPSTANVSDAGSETISSSDARPSYDANRPVWDGSFDMFDPGKGPVSYFNGKVMTKPMHVYPIWYGDWSNNEQAIVLIEEMLRNLSSSSYYKINTAYYQLGVGMEPERPDAAYDANYNYNDDTKTYATDTVSLASSLRVGFTHGTSLTMDDVAAVVRETIEANVLTASEDDAYLVLTSKGVAQTMGSYAFCSHYCGWHFQTFVNDVNVKYLFVGDTETCADDGCSLKHKYQELSMLSPNENWSADGMLSSIAHELSEIITDPNPVVPGSAWRDNVSRNEGADLCAWNYGKLYSTDNNSVANVHIGDKDYILQRNWALLPDGGQGCTLGQ